MSDDNTGYENDPINTIYGTVQIVSKPEKDGANSLNTDIYGQLWRVADEPAVEGNEDATAASNLEEINPDHDNQTRNEAENSSVQPSVEATTFTVQEPDENVDRTSDEVKNYANGNTITIIESLDHHNEIFDVVPGVFSYQDVKWEVEDVNAEKREDEPVADPAFHGHDDSLVSSEIKGDKGSHDETALLSDFKYKQNSLNKGSPTETDGGKREEQEELESMADYFKILFEEEHSDESMTHRNDEGNDLIPSGVEATGLNDQVKVEKEVAGELHTSETVKNKDITEGDARIEESTKEEGKVNENSLRDHEVNENDLLDHLQLLIDEINIHPTKKDKQDSLAKNYDTKAVYDGLISEIDGLFDDINIHEKNKRSKGYDTKAVYDGLISEIDGLFDEINIHEKNKRSKVYDTKAVYDGLISEIDGLFDKSEQLKENDLTKDYSKAASGDLISEIDTFLQEIDSGNKDDEGSLNSDDSKDVVREIIDAFYETDSLIESDTPNTVDKSSRTEDSEKHGGLKTEDYSNIFSTSADDTLSTTSTSSVTISTSTSIDFDKPASTTSITSTTTSFETTTSSQVATDAIITSTSEIPTSTNDAVLTTTEVSSQGYDIYSTSDSTSTGESFVSTTSLCSSSPSVLPASSNTFADPYNSSTLLSFPTPTSSAQVTEPITSSLYKTPTNFAETEIADQEAPQSFVIKGWNHEKEIIALSSAIFLTLIMIFMICATLRARNGRKKKQEDPLSDIVARLN